jgi:hypothetical protein
MPLPRPTRQPETEVLKSSIPTSERKDFRPSDVFRFDPQSDITVAELAYLVSVFWTLDVNYDRFLEFSEELQRNFRPIESPIVNAQGPHDR